MVDDKISMAAGAWVQFALLCGIAAASRASALAGHCTAPSDPGCRAPPPFPPPAAAYPPVAGQLLDWLVAPQTWREFEQGEWLHAPLHVARGDAGFLARLAGMEEEMLAVLDRRCAPTQIGKKRRKKEKRKRNNGKEKGKKRQVDTEERRREERSS